MIKIVLAVALMATSTTYGWHSTRLPAALRTRGLCTLKAALHDDKGSPQSDSDTSNILLFSKGGPGHVAELPSSYTNQGQRELARIIVGIAILYMSFKVKVQEVYAQANAGDSDTFDDASPIASTPDSDQTTGSIRFVDVVKGKTTPKEGQQVYITAKFLHNGLRLNMNDEEEDYVSGRFVQHSADRAKLAGAIREQYRLPEELSSVLADCYMGMCLDGRRQASITLPSGLPPFVLPGGTVVADIEMKTATKLL